MGLKRPLLFGAVLIALALTTVLAMQRMRGAAPAAAPAATGSAAGELGAPPPADATTSPASAKRYIEQQSCLAACAAEHRTCVETADDDGAGRCDDARKRCDAACK